MDLTAGRMLTTAFVLLALGAVVALFAGGNWRRTGYIAFVFTAAAGALLLYSAGRAVVSGAVETGGASLGFRIDRLSAVFVIAVALIGPAAMLYAVSYMARSYRTHSPRAYYPSALLLIVSIVGTITCRDMLCFLVFWELMTLSSWMAVAFGQDAARARTVRCYFISVHIATACLLLATAILYSGSHSLGFDEVARTMDSMARTNPALLHTVLALLFVAFATNAGLLPFGAWLPETHPLAPSPSSALLSGAMIKIGVYGVARFFFVMAAMPDFAIIWGGIIAVLGTLSIFLGAVTALRQDDAKRVLTFHSTSQVGYMWLALGTSLCLANTSQLIGALALVAGLFHMFNHCCYKPLLFLNVGAAECSTGTRDLNKLGGLGSVMPVTLCAALIASLSISGMPPLNGFASKWLIYQSTFQGGLSKPLFLLLGLVALFVSLVTLASFMKLLGSVYMGKKSEVTAQVVGEVPASMQVPQAVLALPCVALGVAPVLALMVLYGAAADVLGPAGMPGYAALFGTDPTGVALASVGAWKPAAMLAALAGCTVAAGAVLKLASAPSRAVASWYGGEELAADEVRYRAHGFVLPFKEALAKICPPSIVTGVESMRTYMIWNAAGLCMVAAALLVWTR